MQNFDGLGLNPVLAKSLAHMEYNTPTPIQAQAIPLALQGRDIMGSAQTGTGKTAAFAIPLVEKLLSNPHGSALVLTPTRELGKQIMDIMHQLLGPKSNIKTAFIIGGEPMGKQFSQLRMRPRLIVGTPGRINDHLRRGSLMLNDTGFLVLDETDRMLDMGFSIQLEEIFKFLPAQRQTLMFSATLPKNILKLAEKFLNKPERIAVGSTITPAKNIKQDIVHVGEDKKYEELLRQLNDSTGSVIIFVKTKHGTEKLAKRLGHEGLSTAAIHGDLRQSQRERVIRDFRVQKFRILVATDVVARGLDIPHIEHVVNYDLPQVPEDYIHRIGRTARAGAEGSALCLISPQDRSKWHAIEMLMNPDMAGKAHMPQKSGQKRNARRPFNKSRPQGQGYGMRDGAGRDGARHGARDGARDGVRENFSRGGDGERRAPREGAREQTRGDGGRDYAPRTERSARWGSKDGVRDGAAGRDGARHGARDGARDGGRENFSRGGDGERRAPREGARPQARGDGGRDYAPRTERSTRWGSKEGGRDSGTGRAEGNRTPANTGEKYIAARKPSKPRTEQTTTGGKKSFGYGGGNAGNGKAGAKGNGEGFAPRRKPQEGNKKRVFSGKKPRAA